MMVPEQRRRCSAADFANGWLKQQQAKQQQAGRHELQDTAGRADGIRAQHDQNRVLVGAV
jgi:hypothetical protein